MNYFETYYTAIIGVRNVCVEIQCVAFARLGSSAGEAQPYPSLLWRILAAILYL